MGSGIAFNSLIPNRIHNLRLIYIRMEYVPMDLKSLCRACNCEAWEMKPLYYSDPEASKEDPRFDEMLMACTSVQVNNEDGLSKLICGSCSVQLKNAYSFKKQCERTDSFLKDYLKWLKKQESGTGDEELTDNLAEASTIDETGNDVDDPKSNPEKVDEENMDYIEVVDNNLTSYECKTCYKVFYTLEGLNCHKKMHTSKAFKCKHCDRSYTKLNLLQKHELSHDKRKKHVCKICKKTLSTLAHLKRHLAIHAKQKSYSCPNCNCGFKHAEHLRTHSKSCKGEKVYACDICNKEFTNEDSMEIHRREHGSKQPALATLDNINNVEGDYMKIEVDDKPNIFSYLSDREDAADEAIEPEVEISENNYEQKLNGISQITEEAYIETDPSDMLETIKIKEEIIRDDEIDNAEKDDMLNAVSGNDYDCDSNASSEYVPLKAAPTKRGRGRPAKHKLGMPRGRFSLNHKTNSEANPESTTYECPECKLIFNELNIFERHAEQHGLKMYECETCHKKFSQSKHLKMHKLSHLKTKAFACTTCNKSFSKRDLLKKHVKLHTSKVAFHCGICHVVFSKEENLKKHKDLKHSMDTKVHHENEVFQCKICQKIFVSEPYLRKHMKSHKDSSKKFMCTECGQRFARNDYLVIHMRRHSGEKPFKCKFCGKGFIRTTDVTVHERYHTGEKTELCVICGKAFTRAYNLTVHMRTHTGEKPYRCTYCDAAFTQSYDMKTHIRRKHTGERYKCELCSDTFIMGYHLKQHKKVVHGLNIPADTSQLRQTTKLNPDETPNSTN